MSGACRLLSPRKSKEGATRPVRILLVALLSFDPLAAAQQPAATRPPQAAVESSAKQALRRAAALIEQGKFREAEEPARHAVELAPASAQGHNLLGLVHDQLGRAAEAEKEYREALRLDPKHVSARHNLGSLLLQQGKLEQARVELEKVLRQDPKHAQAHFNLGRLLAAERKFAEAAQHFQAARKLRGDDRVVLLAFIEAALKAERPELHEAALRGRRP